MTSTSREQGFIASRHSLSTRRCNRWATGVPRAARGRPRGRAPRAGHRHLRAQRTPRAPVAPSTRCLEERSRCNPPLVGRMRSVLAMRATSGSKRSAVFESAARRVSSSVIPINVHSSPGNAAHDRAGKLLGDERAVPPTCARSRSPTRAWRPRKWSFRTHQSSRAVDSATAGRGVSSCSTDAMYSPIDAGDHGLALTRVRQGCQRQHQVKAGAGDMQGESRRVRLLRSRRYRDINCRRIRSATLPCPCGLLRCRGEPGSQQRDARLVATTLEGVAGARPHRYRTARKDRQ